MQIDTVETAALPKLDESCDIDFEGAQTYFQLLQQALGEQKLNDATDSLIQELRRKYRENRGEQEDPEVALMCTRGLLLLLHNKAFTRYPESAIAIAETFVEETDLTAFDLVVQHLIAMPKVEYHQYIMELQSLLATHVVSGKPLNMSLVMAFVKMLDIFHKVNFNLREPTDQIHEKEFINRAVNSDVALDPSISEWRNRTMVQIRNEQEITHATSFNICSYHWILNPANKRKMLEKYNQVENKVHQDHILLQLLWCDRSKPPPFKFRRYKNDLCYVLQVSRADVLNESLEKICNTAKMGAYDPLKFPLMVEFKNEPGIDEGGVRREYFQLVIKEILKPDYDMWRYHEDVRLYWINGNTYEMPVYYELIGILLGMAVYTGTFIDLPFPRAAFKLLLDEAPTLEDLEELEPELAKSLRFILDFDEAKEGAKFEDLIFNTFTTEEKQFGHVELIQRELKEGGKDIAVTMGNRQEYVDLLVDFKLRKQCVT